DLSFSAHIPLKILRTIPPIFFLNPPPTTEIYTLSLHDALPIFDGNQEDREGGRRRAGVAEQRETRRIDVEVEDPRRPARELALRSEEYTSELQSRGHLVCRLLLEKKKKREGGRHGETATEHQHR